jgi:ATP-dependent helicase/nuclease subunit A
METKQPASSPQHSSTVLASAGTGKTWLLVTRLVRLLLEGTAPDSILAITFTRKAAAEMSVRLVERLYVLSQMDVTDREQALLKMGIKPTASLLQTAASLYENHLFDPHQLRITTFHAFCQELLRRFPLEADIPAGFEVLDATRLLEEEAWEALVDEATRSPDSTIARDLEALFQYLNGHLGTKAALMQFLNHRSDWWSYTLGEADPVDYAFQTLSKQLDVNMEEDPIGSALTASIRGELQIYSGMLMQHGTKTYKQAASNINDALKPENSAEECIAFLDQALLRKSITPKASNALIKSLGEDGQDRFIAMHDKLRAWLLDIQDQYRRRRLLTLSHSWFRAGTRLLANYQRIKAEQRLLDFGDLEWKTYILLNHADHALWIQYKLDQRIDHLLIDEFQDTNPTQWHLIFPILQELAAAENMRQRSVFLVGDVKQSIYRFRRAEPELFLTAREWLHDHVDAVDHTLTASWRSSQAIVDFVNTVFGSEPLLSRLAEFHSHSTHRGDLWGQVEIMPLITADKEVPSSVIEFRNPLHRPRELLKDSRHHNEGKAIAEKINDLVGDKTIIGSGNEARPVRFDDVMILVRSRTHVQAYEAALREAHIPYITASRGTLLDCIEISDIVSLLQFLIVPNNNLSLATVLRSPLFACSDDELMLLAEERNGHWLQRLLILAPHLSHDTPLSRAAYWLSRWQNMAGHLPVHDLLDRIYSEGNVVARYESALPSHLHSRMRANLTRFIELALETDSGRYPSLTTFLRRLATLQAQEDDAPDEASFGTATGNVRLLTIHAAKGLESPIVFLADSTAVSANRHAYQAMVRWPARHDRPTHFLLCGKKDDVDNITAALLQDEAQQELREQINLLYVAVTRAKQILFISGCKPNRGDDLGWYGMICNQLGNADVIKQNGWRKSSGKPSSSHINPVTAISTKMIDPRLSMPIPSISTTSEIAPSRIGLHSIGEDGIDDGRLRGLAIHRFLQLLGDNPKSNANTIIQHVITELDLDTKTYPIEEWFAESERIVTSKAFQEWFNPTYYDKALNEVPIYYYVESGLVHGVIDRLILKGENCILIDYKTHSDATIDRLDTLAIPYLEQLRFYANGIKLLWPDRVVHSFILFTACAAVYQLQE